MLVAIDDGHGLSTPGKRTPFFPDFTFMHENEFNDAVAQLLKINLERCGIETLMVALGNTDVALSERVKFANAVKPDIYVSIHANAMTGEWQEASGIETFHYPTSAKGKVLAEIIHKHILQGTPLKDRGVKTANFYVLKYTNMPAVLVECGFMDNYKEAVLLLSGAYRKECSDEIAKGICEYFKVAWIPIETDFDKLMNELKDVVRRYEVEK